MVAVNASVDLFPARVVDFQLLAAALGTGILDGGHCPSVNDETFPKKLAIYCRLLSIKVNIKSCNSDVEITISASSSRHLLFWSPTKGWLHLTITLPLEGWR